MRRGPGRARNSWSSVVRGRGILNLSVKEKFFSEILCIISTVVSAWRQCWVLKDQNIVRLTVWADTLPDSWRGAGRHRQPLIALKTLLRPGGRLVQGHGAPLAPVAALRPGVVSQPRAEQLREHRGGRSGRPARVPGLLLTGGGGGGARESQVVGWLPGYQIKNRITNKSEKNIRLPCLGGSCFGGPEWLGWGWGGAGLSDPGWTEDRGGRWIEDLDTTGRPAGKTVISSDLERWPGRSRLTWAAGLVGCRECLERWLWSSHPQAPPSQSSRSSPTSSISETPPCSPKSPFAGTSWASWSELSSGSRKRREKNFLPGPGCHYLVAVFVFMEVKS